MDNERENLPTAIFAQIRLEALKSILPVIVGEDEKLTRGQLRLLALRLRRSIVPRGDYLIRDQDLVSNIYILAEGSVKVSFFFVIPRLLFSGLRDTRAWTKHSAHVMSVKMKLLGNAHRLHR